MLKLAPVNTDNIADLAALHLESFGKSAWGKKMLQDSILLDTTRCMVACCDEIICGFIITQHVENTSEVLTFCVMPSQRRRGIGRALVDNFLDTLDDSTSVNLEVASDNTAAISLYSSAGFNKVGCRHGYYNGNDGYILKRDSREITMKRLRMLSCQRGIRETTFLLSNFANKYLDKLSRKQLDDFARLLEAADLDIMEWLTNNLKNNIPMPLVDIVATIRSSLRSSLMV